MMNIILGYLRLFLSKICEAFTLSITYIIQSKYNAVPRLNSRLESTLKFNISLSQNT